MKNIIAIVVLLVILGGIGYVYYIFMQNIRYAMNAKDFEQEINRQLKHLLREFDDRSYYGDFEVIRYDPFTCDDLLFCSSPNIVLGTKDIQIMLSDNRVFVSDLSDDRLSLRFESHVQPRIDMKRLKEQSRKDVELIESLLPHQIHCQLISHTRGKHSTLSKHASCELSTKAASYHIQMSSESFNPAYANVSVPTLLLGMARFSDPNQAAKTKIAIQNMAIQIHSKNLPDKIFEIVQKTKFGSLLNRSSYDSAIYSAVSGVLETLAEGINNPQGQKVFSLLSTATANFLLNKASSLGISVSIKKDKEAYYFSEEEVEEFGYQIREEPKKIIGTILDHYDINIKN